MTKTPRTPDLAGWHQLAAESAAGKLAKEKGLANFLRRGSRKARKKLNAAVGKKVMLR
jgi:hypothetical protein